MSKKGLKQSNIRRMRLVEKYRSKREDIKSKIKEARMKKDVKTAFKYQQELDKLPTNSNPTRVRNRCMITNRSGGIMLYKHFGLCSFKIREFANRGCIPGVRKKS